MADQREPNDAELASAYLDGEVTVDERARVEGDPALLAEVSRLRAVRAAVAVAAPAAAASRETAIAAALAAFDEGRADLAATAPVSAPANVVSLERRRHARLMQGLTAAAAAAVLVVGGLVIANRRGDDDSAGDIQQVATTTLRSDSALEVAPSPPVTAPTTTRAAVTEPAGAGASSDAEDLSMAAAPSDLATAASEPAAAEAAEAAGSAPPVVRDSVELGALIESSAGEPPPLDEVVAACEDETRRVAPDAVFEDEQGSPTDVVLATTTDGYAAVSIDDCTIVLRSPT